MKTSYLTVKDKLQGDYLQAFQQVELYACVQNLDENTNEELLMEVLDLLLTAQKEGRGVERVLGADVEQFCQQYFDGYLWRSKLKSVAEGIYRLMWIALVFQLVEVLFCWTEEGNTLLSALCLPTDIAGYLTGFGGGLIALEVLRLVFRPFLFRAKKVTAVTYSVGALVLSLAVSFGLLTLLGEGSIQVPNWCALAASGGYVLVYILLRSAGYYRMWGTFRRPKEPGETSFWGSVQAQSKQQLPEALAKRYEGINRRRARRNRPLMTPQEYTDLIRKENRWNQRLWPIVLVLVIAVILFSLVPTFIEEGIVDGLLFVAILMVTELPAYFLFRASFSGDQERQELIQQCDQLGITLPEYIAQMQQEDSQDTTN
jgi:DNA-binding ferritin-like protein (Dps family)